MPDAQEHVLDVEFGRLAAARKIMAVRTSTGSLARDRANAERWVLRFGGGVDPDDGAAVEQWEHSVTIWPAQPVPGAPYVLYIHGGGMVHYSTAVFQPFLRTLANDLGAPVVAFDYLKAPEHTVEQSVARLGRDVEARCSAMPPRELVLAGDSVGGLLALYLALRVLPPVLSRLVLIYPVLDVRVERASYRTFGTGYFLDGEAMRRFRSLLTPFFSGRGFDPFAFSEDDLARLPACSVVTSGFDVLRDEGFAWVDHLAERSVTARHLHFLDLPHDFCLYAGRLASARNAVAEIARTAFSPEGARDRLPAGPGPEHARREISAGITKEGRGPGHG